jgi:hypothetical protein
MRTGGRMDGHTDRQDVTKLIDAFRNFCVRLYEGKPYQTAGTLSLYYNAKFLVTFSAPLSPRSGLSSDRPCGTYGINVITEVDSQLKFSV